MNWLTIPLLSILIQPTNDSIHIDTIKNLNLGDTAHFSGINLRPEDSSYSIYIGKIRDNCFHSKKGFFEDDFSDWYVRGSYELTQEVQDTFFENNIHISTSWGNDITHSVWWHLEDDQYVQVYGNDLLDHLIYQKRYRPKQDEWTCSELLVDLNKEGKMDSKTLSFLSNLSYNSHRDLLNNHDDRLFAIISHAIILFGGFIIIFRPLFARWKVPYLAWQLGLFLLIPFYIFLSYFLKCQIVNTFLIIALPFSLILLIKKWILKKTLGTILLFSPLLLIGLLGYTVLFTSDRVKLGDESMIEIKWKPGTDLIKRSYVKKMISNLTPVNITTNDTCYNIYFNKYEFCNRDFNIITDAPLCWINFLSFHGNVPVTDLSYRECRLILDKLYYITSIRFDIPTITEWMNAVGDAEPKHCDEENYHSIKKGPQNSFGLYNINDNAPEYTSNYRAGVFQLGLAADSLIPCYDFVIISGIVVQDTDISEVVYKDAIYRGIHATFRLVYRPNNIGMRNFNIHGQIRDDKKCDSLPHSILLTSLNGRKIDEIPDYETFEEWVIQSRFERKMIEAIDMSTEVETSFTLPKGIELYDFVPYFWFEGLSR